MEGKKRSCKVACRNAEVFKSSGVYKDAVINGCIVDNSPAMEDRDMHFCFKVCHPYPKKLTTNKIVKPCPIYSISYKRNALFHRDLKYLLLR